MLVYDTCDFRTEKWVRNSVNYRVRVNGGFKLKCLSVLLEIQLLSLLAGHP